MLPKESTMFKKVIPFLILLLGSFFVAISALYTSSFLVILGITIFFWGAIFFYIAPSKLVPLPMLTASAEAASSNIERIILELELSEKGVYLPPKNLGNADFSLVFVPKTPIGPLPTAERITDKLIANNDSCVFITPPGAALSRLFEAELGFSFTKVDLAQAQNNLRKILVETLELAENVQFQVENSVVKVEVAGNVFDEVCQQTDFQPKTHMQIGCLLSSAIACILAKSTGKPIIINNEIRIQKTRTVFMEFQILEG